MIMYIVVVDHSEEWLKFILILKAEPDRHWFGLLHRLSSDQSAKCVAFLWKIKLDYIIFELDWIRFRLDFCFAFFMHALWFE